MKNKGFGHLKTRLFTIKTSKHVGLGGPWYLCISFWLETATQTWVLSNLLVVQGGPPEPIVFETWTYSNPSK